LKPCSQGLPWLPRCGPSQCSLGSGHALALRCGRRGNAEGSPGAGAVAGSSGSLGWQNHGLNGFKGTSKQETMVFTMKKGLFIGLVEGKKLQDPPPYFIEKAMVSG